MKGALETNLLIAHVTPPGTPSPGLSSPHSKRAGFDTQGVIDDMQHWLMSAGSRGTRGQPKATPSSQTSEVVRQRATSEGPNRRAQCWLTVRRREPHRRRDQVATMKREGPELCYWM